MKKSELRKLIREVIKEQDRGSRGKQKVTMDKLQVYKNLGSPKTWGEFEKAYSRWYHMAQPESPNGEPANSPEEVSVLLRGKGNEPIGPQPEERIGPFVGGFIAGFLVAWMMYGVMDDTDDGIGGIDPPE